MSKTDFKLNLFFKEALIFLITQGLGLVVAWRLLQTRLRTHVPPELRVTPGLSVLDFLLSFFLATIIILILLRLFKRSVIAFEIIFAFTVFVGSLIVFETFFDELVAFLLAILVAAVRFLIPRVWIQNAVIIISVAGISAWLGLSFSLLAILVILLILSIYDVIAVYKTKHMVSMFRDLMEKGVYFSTIVPERTEQLSHNLTEVQPEKGFLFLGTGDTAIPLMFAVSALPFKLISSLAIMIGALLGIFAMHLLFISQKERRPMPALPPIALGSIIGFLVSLII